MANCFHNLSFLYIPSLIYGCGKTKKEYTKCSIYDDLSSILVAKSRQRHGRFWLAYQCTVKTVHSLSDDLSLIWWHYCVRSCRRCRHDFTRGVIIIMPDGVNKVGLVLFCFVLMSLLCLSTLYIEHQKGCPVLIQLLFHIPPVNENNRFWILGAVV